MFVAVVLVVLGPLAYFDVNKTKYIQILTTVFRWVSFASMIILAGIALGGGKGKGHPPAVNFNGLPNLFGVCVYSFMCHHSLPTLITPIARKRKIYWLLFSDYGLILGFYLLLSFTGSYTFDVLQDMYTLNFQPQK
jgi:amino acid permease